MSDDESSASDVSLDEEDEALIWRVFYSKEDDKDASMVAQLASEEEEDFDDLSDIEDQELVAKYRQLKEQENKSIDEDEKRRLLITSFTNDQMDRFEAYRRMTVNKPGVKKVCNSVLGHLISQNIAVVMAGILKLLLGDIITKAFEVQQREFKTQLILDIEAKKRAKRLAVKNITDESNVSSPTKLEYLGDKKSPLQPEHIREAWRLMQFEQSGALPSKYTTEGDGDGKMFR